MEIYNEEINDLLTVENQKLQIHESLEVSYRLELYTSAVLFCTMYLIADIPWYFFQNGVFVAGLREEIVNGVEQVLKIIEFGEGLDLLLL